MTTHAAALVALATQVLFFTKSSEYEHAVIREKDGQPSLATTTLRDLGGKHGFDVTATKDGGVFTKDALARFDVVVFFTTGDLTQEGRDKNPPMPPGGKEALLQAIESGKGFVGIHAAADTFHSGPDRFTADGAATDPYLTMLGGEFIRHGKQQVGRLQCADPKFPGLAGRDAPVDLHEEWYSFKNLAPDLHVLQWLATWSLRNTGGDSVYRRPPYPVTWARLHGKGRVFYTALGHRDDVWQSAAFQELLAGGITWAAKKVEANVTANAAEVTPGYAELPPEDPTLTPTPTPTPVAR
jgi:type 1 glutamine amidotransferase